jgi:uncharacterized membrane protein required for colicin V production
MELMPLDFVLAGLAALLAGIGLYRGLSGELGSLAGFAAASGAGFFLIGFARVCADAVGFGQYAATAAYVVDFVFALVAFGLARWIVAKFVSVMVPQPTNAFLGMLSGLFKSAVVIALLAGFGLMQPGTYSTGFFATHSTIVREVAAWADASLAEAPEQ